MVEHTILTSMENRPKLALVISMVSSGSVQDKTRSEPLQANFESSLAETRNEAEINPHGMA